MQIKTILVSVSAVLMASSVFADSSNKSYIVVAPECLIQKAKIHYQMLSTQDQFLLIKINEVSFNQLIASKKHQKTLCGGFINVTDAYNNQKQNLNIHDFLTSYIKSSDDKKPLHESYEIHHQKEVNQLLSQLNPQNMWSNLTILSSFKDRYAGSDTGVKAAKWIKEQVDQMAKQNNRSDVISYFVSTGPSYKQPSVVAKIGKGEGPGVVMGAHMDTLSSFWGNMPGADDDGTGTVTVLEVARTLLASGMEFKKPIYLIWYSAEEMGLVGSQYVVSDFKNKKIPVEAVFHLDMTGYENDSTMWLIKDYTNKDLTTYLETLINTYIQEPVKYTACGYACSDHATWNNNGFKSAISFESEFGKDNPNIHTSEDTMENLSLEHMTRFAKLGLAFVGELAEPV